MNRNTLYAQIFVDELIRAGLKHVCLSPGSRNTPLVLAFAENKDRITVYSHLDERSAAFFALGMAMATDEPVALCCTSGSAGANYFPAIVEAHQSRIPLIVLTADRPPELRHSGANQTIDQIKLYGDYALWAVDMAVPEANPPAVAIRNLRTTANRAYTTANGLRKGVVHLNLPFRKPLEPTPIEGEVLDIPSGAEARDNAFTQMYSANPVLTYDIEWLKSIIENHENGLIICGGGLPDHSGEAIQKFATLTGYPVFAEAHSHSRFGYNTLGGYEFYISAVQSPDVIIRFGDVPISNALNAFITRSQPKYTIQISRDGVWADDSHLTTHFLHASVEAVANALSDVDERDGSLSTQYALLETTTWQVVDDEIAQGDYFDGAVIYDVIDLIPDESTLFAGNSLPVRHLDQFGKRQNKRIYAYANRGASGIDGNISTALGLGAARPDKPLVAIIGDVTFYHDMNGLLAVHRCGVPVTIVLLNNDGGGIFHRLPIHQYDPAFTDYFVTPHGLDYAHTAKLYGLDYIPANTRSEFRDAFSACVGSGKSTIIEVRTNAQHDLARRQVIMQKVQQVLNHRVLNHRDTEGTKK